MAHVAYTECTHFYTSAPENTFQEHGAMYAALGRPRIGHLAK